MAASLSISICISETNNSTAKLSKLMKPTKISIQKAITSQVILPNEFQGLLSRITTISYQKIPSSMSSPISLKKEYLKSTQTWPIRRQVIKTYIPKKTARIFCSRTLHWTQIILQILTLRKMKNWAGILASINQ